MSTPHDPHQDPDVADAYSFFEEDEPKPKPRTKATRQEEPIDSYEVEGSEPEEEAPAPVRPPVAQPRTKPKTQPILDEEQPRTFTEPDHEVSEVWSRWGEWGATVLKLAWVGALVLVVTYLIASSISLGTGFLVFLLGSVYWIYCSYPIVITLERPVRMTPEQALKDYFGALSHRQPQYRRMWYLLSDTGKNTPEFSSIEEFQRYWREIETELRAQEPKLKTPLSYEVSDFKSEKSAGKTFLEGKYTITAKIRGIDGDPLAQTRITASFTKGPDAMWYLDEGRLLFSSKN